MKWRAALLASLLVLVALSSTAYWVFSTDPGTRWSLARLQQVVPGLEVQLQEGSWSRGLSLQSLSYRAATVSVEIRQLKLRLAPEALLAGELLARQLTADNVTLRLVDDGSPPAESLPTVSLPLGLRVDQLQIAAFELITATGDVIQGACDTGLVWRGTDLSLTAVRLGLGQITAGGEFNIQLQDDYALAAQVQLEGEPLPGAVSLRLRGSLAALEAQAQLAGEFPLAAQASAALLQQDIPLNLSVQGSAPWRLGTGDQPLELHAVQARLAGTASNLAGTANASIREPRFGSSDVQLDLAWRGGKLSLLPVRWQSEGAGSIEGNCDVDTAAASWHCEGAIRALALAPLSEYTQGHLDAGFTANGQWSEDGASISLVLPRLGGELNRQSLGGSVSLSSADFKTWQLGASSVQVGDNRLMAEGSVGDTVALALDLDARELSQLQEAASGRVQAQMAIRGAVAAPDINGRLTGEGIAWDSVQLRQLALDIDVRQLGLQASRLELRGAGLDVSGQSLGDLDMLLEGERARHRIAANLTGSGLVQAAMLCRGELDDSDWGMVCESVAGALQVEHTQRSWALDQPLEVRFDAEPERLQIAPVCLRMQPASLCLPDGLQLQGAQLAPTRLALRQLPLAWWNGLLPPTIELAGGGNLEAELVIDSLQPLQASGHALLDEFSLRWQRGEEARQLVVESVRASLAADAEEVALHASADSSSLGNMRLDVIVSDPQAERGLRGELVVDAVQLAALDGLVAGIEQLAGAIDARLALGGNLSSPSLIGRATLKGGRLWQAGLPYPVEDIAVTVDLLRDHADYSGAFTINSGNGSAAGSLSWEEADVPWRLQGELALDTISIGFLEGSIANISSQLKYGVTPGKVKLGGDLTVNEAEIHLLSLPPESVNPSDDAEIIGAQEPASNWDIDANIAVNLGEQLHFLGFGADLRLAGDLRVKYSRRELIQVLGEVRVASGHYRAYGQRLKIRKGSLLFAGPLDNPDLQLEAIRRNRSSSVIGGLRVTGTLQEPVGELFSEPAMSETDIAHFILTGRVRKSSEIFGEGTAEGTLLSLGLAGANEPAAELARKFGISDFQISAENSEAGTETRVSGYLTSNLMVSYGTLLKDRSNTVTLQYFVTPNIIIEAVSGFSSALDLIYNFTVD